MNYHINSLKIMSCIISGGCNSLKAYKIALRFSTYTYSGFHPGGGGGGGGGVNRVVVCLFTLPPPLRISVKDIPNYFFLILKS